MKGNSKHYHEKKKQDKVFPLFERVIIIIFEVLAREIRQLKEIKGLYMGKEI